MDALMQTENDHSRPHNNGSDSTLPLCSERDAELHALLLKAQAGNKASFRQFVEQTNAFVFRLSLLICCQHEDAEEVTQDVYIRLHKQLQKEGQPPIHCLAWLRRVTLRASLDLLRSTQRRWKRWTAFFRDVGRHSVPPRAIDGISLKETIQALDHLSDVQRTAFVLHIVEGLSCKEIAAMHNCSEKSIEQRIVRARRTLRHHMDR
jgi:RNA polymerase sigma-70 factor (ECF subfamily)